MTSEQVFLLFANVIPVRGARRSTLCDLQRGEYYLISNALYDALSAPKGRPLSEMAAGFSPEEREALAARLEEMAEQGLGRWVDPAEAERFPELDLRFERPERITNAVIDVGPESDHDFERLFAELDGLACKALEIRFYRPAALDEIDRILEPSLGSRLRSIQLILPYDEAIGPDEVEALCAKHVRIADVILYGAPENDAVATPKWNLVYFRQEIRSEADCGEIHPGYFSVNLPTFSEAQAFNTCLNQKIGVDAGGNIKNCPSCVKSYGTAGRVPLEEVAARPEFREVWGIGKDRVAVCRDCEFRYICTDCRAYLADPEDLYSKPAKCAYDPYTASWGAPS